MGLNHISYHKAACDAPGCDTVIENDHLSMTDFRQELRTKGWLIGRKTALCPSCAASPATRRTINEKKKTVKSVILPLAELRNVLASTWGEVAIRLPSNADATESKNLLTPRYNNGDTLIVREGWKPATKTVCQYENGVRHSEDVYDGLIYKADDAEHFPNCPENLDPEFYLTEINSDSKWRSPATMPKNAIRLFLKVKQTRFCKIFHGNHYYAETPESAVRFDWTEEPWYEEITVERCEPPACYKNTD